MKNIPIASKLRAGRIAAAVLAIVSALFCLEGSHYPYMTSLGPGAGFFPVWVGGLGTVLALLMVILPPPAPPIEPALAEATDEPVRPSGAGLLITLTVGCLLAGAALLPFLGFLIVTSLLTAALLWIYERRPIVALVAGILAGPAVVYLFALLQVRLPTGVFGI